MSSADPCVSPDETLIQTVTKMVKSGFPAIPACDSEGRSLGLITEGDIMYQLAYGTNLASTTVGEVATDSYSLALDDNLDAAARALGSAGMSMLPVVENGRLVGVLSWVDITAERRLRTVLDARAADMISEISPTDSMYSGSRGSYVVAGVSALQCVKGALKSLGRAPGRILDLPSGHGRVLRVLKAAFPDAQLTACDLDRVGVDFCARVLGAEGIYSHTDASEVELGGDFDLVWCGSLFTHLDEPRWPGLLDLFGRNLAPGGILLFTTHGRHPANALRKMNVSEAGVQEMFAGYDKTGIGYSVMPIELEEDYGLTIASPEWIRAQIDQQPNLEFISHAPRAWEPPAPPQDVVTCRRPVG